MLSLYRNPTGEGIFTGHETNPAVNVFVSQLGVSAGEEVVTLKKRVKDLEDTINKYKVIKQQAAHSAVDTPTEKVVLMSLLLPYVRGNFHY